MNQPTLDHLLGSWDVSDEEDYYEETGQAFPTQLASKYNTKPDA